CRLLYVPCSWCLAQRPRTSKAVAGCCNLPFSSRLAVETAVTSSDPWCKVQRGKFEDFRHTPGEERQRTGTRVHNRSKSWNRWRHRLLRVLGATPDNATKLEYGRQALEWKTTFPTRA
ncbi:unnamed protein product, partial [Ectocarpus sp. 6 AP-2014]